ATFLVLTEVVHVYAAWSLERERSKHPLLAWEKALMASVAAVTVLVVAGLLLGALVLGWSAVALVDWLRNH
ncbi:MAG TPA: hypothetical protein VLT32_17665, partial [Candidatus Sulfomarinibacteraceae bacterium]|nr:hypothetical protein [Candidatus Sulfomarinibacteraceae bacterium]